MGSSELRWHPEAILDAEAARNWYPERSPFAARGFLLALDDAIGAVMVAPDRWPERSHGCRQFVFSTHYPFAFAYRHSADTVAVIATRQRRTVAIEELDTTYARANSVLTDAPT